VRPAEPGDRSQDAKRRNELDESLNNKPAKGRTPKSELEFLRSSPRPADLDKGCADADTSYPSLPKSEARITYAMAIGMAMEELIATADKDRLLPSAVRQAKSVKHLATVRLRVEAGALEELNRSLPRG